MRLHKKDVSAFCEFLRTDLSESEADLLRRIDLTLAPVGVRPEGEGWIRLDEIK